MNFKNGAIYFMSPCPAAIPVKPKLVLCISKEHNRFYLINSCDENRPYAHEKDFAIILKKFRLDCLTHDSYIALNKLKPVNLENIDKCEFREFLPNDLWVYIKSAVRNFDKDKTRCRLDEETKDIVCNSIKDK
jgi:hypothetical protein